MRLRVRLALAFALLAVVPLALVVPVALSDLRATLSRGLDARIKSAEAAARASLARNAQTARTAVVELADSIALEEFARDLQAGGSAPRMAFAARLMKGRGLSVLSIFDQEGVTLSSGHLPAMLGDPDESLFAVTRQQVSDPVAVMVALRDESGLRNQPALVYAHSVEYGSARLWVVGGTLLDESFAQHLAQLTGAAVDISAKDGAAVTAGIVEAPTVDRVIEFPPIAKINLRFSQAPIVQAEAGLERAFAALTAVGLFLAVLLGIVVARRITRPVEALTAAARQVASGALNLTVEEKGTAEVGELVSAFNRMTAELQRITDQLVASERVAAWQEVAKRLAHEIKNPLTPIQMSLETLLVESQSNNPRFSALFKESAGAMLEEVERLRRIVDEFSRFARLPKPQLAELDLGELVDQVLALYRSPPEGIELRKDVQPGLTVQGDRDQLTQVLMNLLKNAEEAMHHQGVIQVRVQPRDREAVVQVQDSGPGIGPEIKARLFEPYFTTKEGGSGLGLAIASRILQEHGGRLEVWSEPGKGSVFTVALPRVEEAIPAPISA